MKKFLFTRGAPGAGKSFWIEKNLFKTETVSSDEIRLEFSPPIQRSDGTFTINHSNDHRVWQEVKFQIEDRMKNNELVFLDATNQKTKDIQPFINLAKRYNYDIACINFTRTPIKTCLSQNKKRTEYKRVPERIIHRAYERFKNNPIPQEVTVFLPEEIQKINTWIYN